MKKALLFIFYCFVGISVFCQPIIDLNSSFSDGKYTVLDGHFWNSMTKDEKVFFLIGFQNGLLLSFIISATEMTKTGQNNIMSTATWKSSFDHLIKFMDQFYSEENNKDTKLLQMLSVAVEFKTIK